MVMSQRNLLRKFDGPLHMRRAAPYRLEAAAGDATCTPCAQKEARYLELKRTRVTRDDGSEKTVEQVLVTPKGLARFADLIERKAPWLRKVGGTPPPKRPDGPSAGVH